MALRPDVYGREVVPASTAAQAAEADRLAREVHGIPGRLLMENAGRATALLVQAHCPEGPVVAVVGKGNNGGDALVAARTLRAWGRDVAVHLVGDAKPRDDLLHGFDLALSDDDDAPRALAGAGAILDGILGTGASGAPRADAAAAIERMNAAGRPVVALDLPSGVNADTGAVPGAAVRADLTICFGAVKLGLLFQPGRAHCGRLVATEIAFPPPDLDALGAFLITPGWAAARLPGREPDAHKGTVGRLAVLAGGPGMGGAAILAARGAARAGAGLVYACSHADNRVPLQSTVPDAIFVDRDAPELEESVGRCGALVAGAGLGRGDDALDALDRALDALPDGAPALLDADAVTLLAREDRLGDVAGSRPLVITPHAGEFASAAGVAPEELDEDRPGHARRAAKSLGCVVLLKGLPSLVATPDGVVRVNTVGSSDLATAGMGDHLSGAIGAFLVNGAAVADAASLGLFYSSRAADLAGLGRSLLPDDVADALARAFREPGPTRPPAGLPFVTFDQPPRW